MNDFPRIDMLLPPELAQKAEDLGVNKASMGWRSMFLLSILAGAFIALGAVFATTVTAGASAKLPFGFIKLIGGIVFCVGLILVITAGAELFTGNNLIIMALASRKITIIQLLRSWIIVYIGNFVGSVMTAFFMIHSQQYMFGKGIIGLNILDIANGKCELGFIQAVALGMMCNGLVCLAIWICLGARTMADKILATLFPISAFVASGFEHCVANMYFISIGIFVKMMAPLEFWKNIGKTTSDFTNLTLENFFFVNLLPVTIGNIIGGSVLVGLVYWFIYIRKLRVPLF
jgi:formate transporter FocA